MFFANVIYSEVVDSQCELYQPCVMFPKTIGSHVCSIFFQEVCLLRGLIVVVHTHAMLSFYVDAAIFGCFLSELILVNYFIGMSLSIIRMNLGH